MFDAIGYAAAVSIITLALFSPLLWILPILVTFMIKVVTEDKHIAERFSDSIFEFGSDDVTLFNKYTIPFMTFLIPMVISSALSFTIHLAEFIIPYGRDNTKTYVEFIQGAGEYWGPVAGWITLIGTAWILFVFISRRGYRLYLKVNELLNKLDETKSK